MSRAYVSGYIRDHYGTSYRDGIVYLYEAGTTIAAKMYEAETGGSAIYHVNTNRQGFYEYWVDQSDYGINQRFKETHTSNLMVTQEYDNLDLLADLAQILMVELLVADYPLAAGTVLGGTEVPVASELDGCVLYDVEMFITPSGTVSSSGACEFQIVRTRGGSPVDMLTQNLVIAQGDSIASAVSINTNNDDVETGDFVSIDCESDGTGVLGPLWVKLTFR